jgi:hypothetical protein
MVGVVEVGVEEFGCFDWSANGRIGFNISGQCETDRNLWNIYFVGVVIREKYA